MRRHAAIAAVAAVTLTPPLVAYAQSSTPVAPAPAPSATATPLPTVVRTIIKKPQAVMKLTDHFHPPAFPTPWYVMNVIAPYEAAKWGAPLGRLRCRINGESGGSVNATNGQYQGVGQFAAETFSRGVATIGLRRVTMVRRHERLRAIRVIEFMSDGTVQRRFDRKIRQLIEHRLVGKLPANPPRRHAWAQVRIMARAMVGLGGVNDGEWSVRC